MDQDLVKFVSYHAVTRFVQRVLGVVVVIPADDLAAEAGREGRYMAKRHCDAAGVTIDTVRRAIMTPAVQVASRCGLSIATTDAFQARLVNGVVVTVQTRWKPTRKMRHYSETEGRADAHKHNRRMRRGHG